MDETDGHPPRSGLRGVRSAVQAISPDASGDPALQRGSELLQRARRELGDETFDRAIASLGTQNGLDAMVDALEQAGGQPMEWLRSGLIETREAVQALQAQIVPNEPIVREALKPSDSPEEVMAKMGEGDVRAIAVVAGILELDPVKIITSFDDMNIRGGQLLDAYRFAGRSIVNLLQVLGDPREIHAMVGFINASSESLGRKQAAVIGGARHQRPPLLGSARPEPNGPSNPPVVG